LCNAAARRICNVRESRAVGLLLEKTDIHPEVTRLACECISGKSVLVSEVKLPGWPQQVINIRAAWYLEAGAGTDITLIILHDLTKVRRHELSRKEFVANVSHEIKTSITAVSTTAEALLDIARRDSGITKTEKSHICMAEIINRAVSVVSPQAAGKYFDRG
jgi:signal transduction histidine kinase